MSVQRTVTLKLEAIGDDSSAPMAAWERAERAMGISGGGSLVRRPWVAEITGFDGRFGFARAFLQGQKDYSEANSIGSRGVHLWYHLREGGLYQVRELLTWKRERRYYCTVSGGAVVEVSKEEVQTALNERGDAGEAACPT